MTTIAPHTMHEAQSFWHEQRQKHPTLYGILCLIGSVTGFFFNGHFIVALGRWVVLTSGRIAETALLFATLWITATYVAPNFTAILGGTATALSSLSLLAFSLLPEVILFHAIVTTYQHWSTALYEKSGTRRVGASLWAVLYTLPTATFFSMTVYTICTFASHDGRIGQASGTALSIRCLAGWLYGLIGLIRATIGKHQHRLSAPTPPQPVPTSVEYQEIAHALMPFLAVHLHELRASILHEVKPLEPAPLNYPEIAQAVAPLVAPTAVPSLDYQEIARAIVPLLHPSLVEVRHAMLEEVKSALSPMTAQASESAMLPLETSMQTASHSVEWEEQAREEHEAERNVRLEVAYQQLVNANERVSGRRLAEKARCNRNAATTWYQHKIRSKSTEDDQEAGMASIQTEQRAPEPETLAPQKTVPLIPAPQKDRTVQVEGESDIVRAEAVAQHAPAPADTESTQKGL